MKSASLITGAILLVCSLSVQSQWLRNGDAIYNDNTGNIGLGTSNPSWPLTNVKPGVAWTTFGIAKYPQFMVNGSNQSGGGLAISDDGGFFDWNDGYVTYEPLCCNAGLRVSRSNFIVDNNVGIGTTNTGSFRLAVEGKIGARKVVVTQANPWPDYVFHPTYRLRPLSEVEQYIQQHHRLPEVPSAADIEKDGLDVGDNQAMLLKKVEELTLYLIEEHKKNEAQQREIEALKATIQALSKGSRP